MNSVATKCFIDGVGLVKPGAQLPKDFSLGDPHLGMLGRVAQTEEAMYGTDGRNFSVEGGRLYALANRPQNPSHKSAQRELINGQ